MENPVGSAAEVAYHIAAIQPKEAKGFIEQIIPSTPIRSITNTGIYTPKTDRVFPLLNVENVPGAVGIESYWDKINQYPEDVFDSIRYHINEARAVLDKVRELSNYVDYLGPESLFELPVGISRNIGGLEYTILIHQVLLKPTHAELDAYMFFETPQGGDPLVFMGRGIKFSSQGGIVGDATLELIGNRNIPFGGSNSRLVIKGGPIPQPNSDGGFSTYANPQGKTFIRFDCSGFLEMGLAAELEFSKNLLLKEREDGSIDTANVKAYFETQLADWNDMVVAIDLPRFQVIGLRDVSFLVKNAIFDFSDTRNAPGVKFPEGYSNPFGDGAMGSLWRGVYVQELSITLPPQFETIDNSERTSFTAYDMLIDNQGVSGDFVGRNLISIEKGKVGNWAFSLDSIGVGLVANGIREAGFNGLINIPINDQTKNFGYTALINPGNEYIFAIENRDDLKFELWSADVTLYESSYIEIRVVERVFKPKAYLNGTILIDASLSASNPEDKSRGLRLAGLQFEGIEIQTEAPFVKIGAFSLGSEGQESRMADFPISINNIYGEDNDDKLGLGFDIDVHLQENAISGGGALQVWGELDNTGRLPKYNFDRVQVDAIRIDTDTGPFSFNGQITFFRDDAVYGDGFNGQLQAKFTPGVEVQATAIFGNVDGYRYWFADALATFQGGLPFLGVASLSSFGGGAYYRMSIDNQGVGSNLGETISGITYIPNQQAGLGFKATIGMHLTGSQSLMNAEATYEMSFFRGGGVRYIAFKGKADLLTLVQIPGMQAIQDKLGKIADAASELQKSLPPGAEALLAANNEPDPYTESIYGGAGISAGSASISAVVFISYDFENRVLHGNFEAYINVAGGVLKGSGPDGRAGQMVLHVAPGEWYVYVGRPEYENRIGVSLLGIAQVGAYFVMGSKIPGSPPPPAKVSEILGDIDLDYMKELNELGQGRGVGFGANLDIDTGDLTFLIFYARFAAGLGFDVMIKDYGDARCEGRSGTIGINGWYANGQAYAYVEGSIGIKIKIFRKNKKFEILGIGAAVVLQAKLPNPFWFRGIVGGYFRILGGLIKGRCRFEFEIGEECRIVPEGSILETLNVISELTPANAANDISVFTVPQAVFNYEIDKPFEMVDYDEKLKRFRIKLDKFEAISDGQSIEGELKWNDTKDVLGFTSFETLPSLKEIQLEAQVSFQEQVNSVWEPVKVDNETLTEDMQDKFTTGEAPDYIPPENVEYTYPIENQRNFYPAETSQGYVKLIRGQSYLFDGQGPFRQEGRFVEAGGTSYPFGINYSQSEKQVNLSLPANLPLDRIYGLKIINVPKNYLGSVDTNVDTISQTVLESGEDLSVEQREQQATGSIQDFEENLIYGYFVRSSQYKSFRDKLNQLNISSGAREPLLNYAGVHLLSNTLSGGELFDQDEVGFIGSHPFVQFEAELTNVAWYKNEVYPLVYEGYPYNNLRISWRDVNVAGEIPSRVMYIRQYPYDLTLTEQDILVGSVTRSAPNAGFIYDVAYYMNQDYLDLQQQAAVFISRGGASNARLSKLLGNPFPFIRRGNYPFKVKYVLPGTNRVTSETRIIINNPVE